MIDMSNWGSVDLAQLYQFRDDFEKISQEEIDNFMRDVAKEFAARFLRLVIKATPVGKYPKGSGKTGGTLRRGWTASKSVNNFVDGLSVKFEGGSYVIEIVNDVDYASYVEYGHRTPGGAGWVKGRFMMTKSELIAKRNFQKIAEKRMLEFLQRQMKK